MKYHIFISKKELLTGIFFIVGFLFLDTWAEGVGLAASILVSS